MPNHFDLFNINHKELDSHPALFLFQKQASSVKEEAVSHDHTHNTQNDLRKIMTNKQAGYQSYSKKTNRNRTNSFHVFTCR